PAGADEFRLRLIAKAGNPFLGSLALARLDFVAASSNSALVRIPLTDAQALRAAGGLLARPDVRDGKVVIIGDDPLLEASLDAHRERTLVLYGRPGRHYSIQSSAHLNNGGDWKAWQETDLSTSWQEVLGPPTSDPVAYYRALRSERSTLRLTARSELGQFVLEWPATEDVCAIFESTSLDTDATWTLSPSLPSRVGDSYQLAIPIAGDVRFYRLRCLSAGKP
ncbi:MAG: hypothetical protein HYR88_11250, partial [Verrucomicrobia bacterium]|nr:hypothetical protein [Verrucomicrobiota bacterium]